MNRRRFVAAAGATLSLAAGRGALANITSDEAWARAADIAKKVRAPTFANRVFDITRFGAKPDGITLNTSAIADAIAECARAGGGRVLVPAGTFLTGAIRLKSNVELYVSEGATLKFDTNPSRYPLVFTRWEGM
ncbi:MAG TPA: glycosyl hydrolase family 28-related protein, partial [Steroidobacteraceae bacterium]